MHQILFRTEVPFGRLHRGIGPAATGSVRVPRRPPDTFSRTSAVDRGVRYREHQPLSRTPGAIARRPFRSGRRPARGRRGSRGGGRLCVWSARGSRPAWGAWIETASRWPKRRPTLSRPAWGAWIETAKPALPENSWY